MKENGEYLKRNVTISNDLYDINIEVSHFANRKEYLEQAKKYKLSIVFESVITDFKSNKGTLHFSPTMRWYASEEILKLRQKIKKKVDQHKNSDGYNLIIFTEFEEGFTPYDEMPSNTNIEDIRNESYNGILSDKVSLFFLFKHYNFLNSETAFRLAYDENSFDPELLKIFNKRIKS